MNGKLAKALLIASLVLNLAFISYLVIRKTSPDFLTTRKCPPKRPLLADQSLDLTGDQITRIRSIIKEFRLSLITSKQNMLDQRMGIVEELSTPEPDLDLIWDHVRQLNSLEAALNRDFVTALINVSNILGSGQNIEFLLELSRHWLYFGKKIPGDNR